MYFLPEAKECQEAVRGGRGGWRSLRGHPFAVAKDPKKKLAVCPANSPARLKEELAKGINYFQQAIAFDPNYALAYDGLSYCYGLSVEWYLPTQEAMPRAKGAARKALELDPSLPEAQIAPG